MILSFYILCICQLRYTYSVNYDFSTTFWHINDIHLNLSIGGIGSYEKDSSYTLVKSAIKAMSHYESSPDFIIWNGDNMNHVYKSSPELFFDTVENVTNELRKRFPTIVLLPSLGNHDLNPPNFLESNSPWCAKLLKYWGSLFDKSQNQSFSKGCYYSHQINITSTNANKRVLRIIVLNTILWYNVNSKVTNIEDPSDQFSWFEDQLLNCKRNHELVFIMGHAPPGASEYSPRKYHHLHEKFNIRFIKILQLNSDIIKAGFFAHEHTDAFKIVYNNDDEPKIPLFLSPSVTPLHLHGMGSVNPSIRLFKFPKKYIQYHLKKLTLLKPPVYFSWDIEYESDKIMLPDNLSASSLHKLLQNLSSSQSNSLYPQFLKYHLSGQPHSPTPTETKKCTIICGLRYLSYDKLDDCLDKCPSNHNDLYSTSTLLFTTLVPPVSRSQQIIIIVTIIIVFTIILITAVVYANKTYCRRQQRAASLTRDIYLAPYQGKDCDQIFEQHIDHIAESTFGDVPEYRGHFRNNSRTILTFHDSQEDSSNHIGDLKSSKKKSAALPVSSRLGKSNTYDEDSKPDKYDYQRM